jgi:hypothetical protein
VPSTEPPVFRKAALIVGHAPCKDDAYIRRVGKGERGIDKQIDSFLRPIRPSNHE